MLWVEFNLGNENVLSNNVFSWAAYWVVVYSKLLVWLKKCVYAAVLFNYKLCIDLE